MMVPPFPHRPGVGCSTHDKRPVPKHHPHRPRSHPKSQEKQRPGLCLQNRLPSTLPIQTSPLPEEIPSVGESLGEKSSQQPATQGTHRTVHCAIYSIKKHTTMCCGFHSCETSTLGGKFTLFHLDPCHFFAKVLTSYYHCDKKKPGCTQFRCGG